MIRSTSGHNVPVTMAADLRITGVVKRSLSDTGDAIASTSVRGSDGKLHALEALPAAGRLPGPVPDGSRTPAAS